MNLKIMELKFQGLNEKQINAIKNLEKKLNIKISENGILVDVKKGDNLIVEYKDNKGYIEYSLETSLYRMISLFVKNLRKEKEFSVSQKAYFDACGPMLDMSRNAVFKVDKLKEYIDYYALMGLNSMMLYTEDTYTVDNHPYFGYLRGRYSKEELKEIDDYAFMYGIEVIPCIQTLGHMERYIQWKEAAPVKDTERCIMAESDETMALIDTMFSSLKGCFRTDKIHIGLDEAWDMGTGVYLKKNGYKPRIDIFLDHLKKVKELADKYSYKIMMWSDMFFRILSTDSTYNADISEDVLAKYKDALSDIVPVYWSYHNFDKDFYEKFFVQHKTMCENFAFAGGITDWKGFTSDYYTTINASSASLSKCREHGVKEVYATIWGDNGAECDFFMSLYGLSLYAEFMYGDENTLCNAKENFEFITGASWDAFSVMGDFHNIFPLKEINHPNDKYYGKRILWQDILLSNQECFLKENDMVTHYKNCHEKMKNYKSNNKLWQDRYDFSVALFDFMILKAEIGTNLQPAYKRYDKEYLKDVAENKLDKLYEKLSVLKKLHLDMWYDINKPFGAEVLDTRYSGLLGRINTAKERLNKYLNGEIEKIYEFEEERLPYEIDRCTFYNVSLTPSAM